MKPGLGAALAVAWSGCAWAQVDEVRLGFAGHDIAVIGSIPSLEEAVVLNGEVIFDKPDSWTWRFAPRPYVGGQLNLGGSTSWGGAGLMWRQGLGERFYGDFGFGLVVHDGTLDIGGVRNNGSFRELFFRLDNEREYGSRVLFKEELVLGYRFNDQWAGEAFFEHVSHGGLLSDGPNDGSDSAGFRVARRF